MSELSTDSEVHEDQGSEPTTVAPPAESGTDPNPIEEIEDQERSGWPEEPTTS